MIVLQNEIYVVKLEGRNQVYNVYNLSGEIVMTRFACAVTYYEVKDFMDESDGR